MILQNMQHMCFIMNTRRRFFTDEIKEEIL